MIAMTKVKESRPSAARVTAIWEEYRRTNDSRLRDQLVMTYAPLVKYIVYKKIRELPARCEVEDFISCGLEALIRAIDRWDPVKGATLEQFAWTRIHGAVIDELRRQDWAPRSVRRWERDIAATERHFTLTQGRRPERAELADALDISVDELTAREHEIANSQLTSINTLVLSEDQTIERIDTIASEDPHSDPEFVAAGSESAAKLNAALERLPERERLVAVLMYVKNLTLREIGDVLGVSESRVCQIHGTLKRRLRELLEDDAMLFSEVA